MKTPNVLADIMAERTRQDQKWGQQNHPDGTGRPDDRRQSDLATALCDRSFRLDTGTWRHILEEEVREAYAEDDPAVLRAELVQVAAVAIAWVEAIDRREAGNKP